MIFAVIRRLKERFGTTKETEGNDVVVAEKNAADPVTCVARYPVTHSSFLLAHSSGMYTARGLFEVNLVL